MSENQCNCGADGSCSGYDGTVKAIQVPQPSKVCPLLFQYKSSRTERDARGNITTNTTTYEPCLKGLCAWYDVVVGACAITTIDFKH